MKIKAVHRISKTSRGIGSFFVPSKNAKNSVLDIYNTKRITAIIPTYRPESVTYRLIHNITLWFPKINIVVVDDNTPLEDKKSMRVLENISHLAKKDKQITVLKTEYKLFKANALNAGLTFIAKQKTKPEVVITFDDDVVINQETIPAMIDTLFSRPEIGAACTNAWVKNKKANLLTRLQSLEYHGFNMTKIGDNGFLHGPLVMQGMLAAFKYNVLKKVNGFRTDKLIEDYDITVRIKKEGYKTAIAHKAHAWTYAPESLAQLWKQRIRWSYGGIIVVKDFYRQVLPLFQDLIGHTLFLSLLGLIFLSFVIRKHNDTPPLLIEAILILAICHFILSFTFNILSLLSYKERDRIDWIIKLTILPEFVYSNILSAILLGSYTFFAFNALTNLGIRYFPRLSKAQRAGAIVFHKMGYSLTWGTRA